MADGIIGPPLPEIISRKEAIAKGLPRYFTGKPCKHGHIAERNAANCVCLMCLKQIVHAYRLRHPERSAVSSRLWRQKNPDCRTAYEQENRDSRQAYQAAYREANRDKLRAANAAYQKANPEKVRAGRRKWRLANSGKIRQATIDYREKNREKLTAITRKWRENNPEKSAAICRNRIARKKAAEGSHTKDDVQRIHKAQNGKCAICKTAVGRKYHVDHIQPLTRGGSNAARNLQILCGPCNVRKGARDPIDHARSLGMLL